MIDFTQPLKRLDVDAGDSVAGALERRSQYEFTYSREARRAVSVLMPLEDVHFSDNELFAVMDMNLPEGFLLAQIRERSPKAVPTKMHLLALMGSNGIGWVGYRQPDSVGPPSPPPVNRKRLLQDGTGRGRRLFLELVDAYLSTGSGLSGVQPKILVPERVSIPVPNLLDGRGSSRGSARRPYSPEHLRGHEARMGGLAGRVAMSL